MKGGPVREIVVVGGGPAGLSAALAAARAGAAVTLLDGYARPGGQYYRQPPERLRAQANYRQQQGRTLAEQVRAAGVELCPETLVWNVDERMQLSITGPGGVESLSARAIILATGTYERVVAFPGWTLPGVITTGAAQTLLYQQVKPGRRVLVVGTGPLQLVTGAELMHAGVAVVAVLEGNQIVKKGLGHLLAAWGQWQRAQEGAESLWTLARHGVPYALGWGITAAHGIEQVEGATIARLDADWRPVPGTAREVACDTICVGYGFVPFHALARLAGAQQVWNPGQGGEVPVRDARMQTSLPGIYAAGDGAGIGGYRLALLEGQVAGAAAAARLGYAPARCDALIQRLQPALRRERAFQGLYARLFTPGPGAFQLAGKDTPVCRCEGVTMGQLEAALQAGAGTLLELKALTRCGMGECQGRMCGSTIIPWLAQATGQSPAAIGAFPARPPVFPIPLGAFKS